MKQTILLCCLSIILLSNINAQHLRDINVDLQQEKGSLNKFFNQCIGAGRANEGLRADWQEQFRIVQQECDFKYIRFHGIFHDDMGVYRETKEGNPVYNWQYVDKLYDFILENNMKPFVELSFMPKAMGSGEKTVFWWRGNITPPKSMKKYKSLIKEFVKHLTERYGEEEVKTWYFEVWNEPDHPSFYTGSKEDYFDMYKWAVEAIRSVSTDYKVGGPATAGIHWVEDFLDYCAKNKVPVDFVSAHAYNVNGFLDEFGVKQLKMSKNPLQVYETVSNASDLVANHQLKDLELHITEWNSSYSPLDPVHDTYQNASFVLNTLKKVEGNATSMSYWTFTDIFEEPGVPSTPFHGGFGLINLQGIKKPTYYAYNYLNQLGDIELENDDSNSWVCKQDDNVQLLIWDFTYLNQGDQSNKVFYRQDIKSKLKSKVAVNISNLDNGTYELVIYKTGYKQNDVFTSYYEMGKPSQLSIEQVAYLKSVSDNQPFKKELIKIENGTYRGEINLYENDIVLVMINKL